MIGINKITSLPVSYLPKPELQEIVNMIDCDINFFGNMENGFDEGYFRFFVDEDRLRKLKEKRRLVIN